MPKVLICMAATLVAAMTAAAAERPHRRRSTRSRGGTGTELDWPGILPMWFHYRNPGSGRVPDRYWPDCVPCEVRPQVRLTSNGYQMPPTGPSVDGLELPLPKAGANSKGGK